MSWTLYCLASRPVSSAWPDCPARCWRAHRPFSLVEGEPDACTMSWKLLLEAREDDHHVTSLPSPRSKIEMMVGRVLAAELGPGAVVVRGPADGVGGWTARLFLKGIRLIREEAGPLLLDFAL
jgi:hypothetical protein